MAFDAEITQKSRDLIVLEKARERIARGWCQGRLEDAHGNVCMIGAFAWDWMGAGNPYDYSTGIWPGGQTIAGWNNTSGRTKEEVLARFDQAIARRSNG